MVKSISCYLLVKREPPVNVLANTKSSSRKGSSLHAMMHMEEGSGGWTVNPLTLSSIGQLIQLCDKTSK